jgi:hypothetical protein
MFHYIQQDLPVKEIFSNIVKLMDALLTKSTNYYIISNSYEVEWNYWTLALKLKSSRVAWKFFQRIPSPPS